MGTWGLFVMYDVGVLLLARLLHFAIDPESSWSATIARRARRTVRRVRRRIARPAGRPIEVIARDVRHFGHDLRTLECRTVAELDDLCRSYDLALAEACAALGIVHLLGVLGPGEERAAERARVEHRLLRAGLALEEIR